MSEKFESIAKFNNVLSLVLTAVTIILILIIYPLKEQMSEYNEKVMHIERVEVVGLKQEQAELKSQLAEVKANLVNIEKTINKIDTNVEYLRRK